MTRLIPTVSALLVLLVPVTQLPAMELFFTGGIDGTPGFGVLRVDPEDRSVQGLWTSHHNGSIRTWTGSSDGDGTITVEESGGGTASGTEVQRSRLFRIADEMTLVTGTELGDGETDLQILAMECRYLWHGPNDGRLEVRYPLFTEDPLYEIVAEITEESARRRFDEWIGIARDERGFLGSPFRMDIATWYTPVWADEGVLSLLYSTYSYLGGAHGMIDFSSMLFLRREGLFRPVRLEDLFVQGHRWEKRLSDLVVESLRVQGASDIEAGTITGFDPESLYTFTVTPGGIRFYFAPYAVGAYVEGPYEASIPWEDLRPHLAPAIRDWLSTVDPW